MIYLLTKDYTLWAFEGPEEPDWHSFKSARGKEHAKKEVTYIKWKHMMSTARESALPVVKAYRIEPGSDWFVESDFIANLREGETVALPGWGLEKKEMCGNDSCPVEAGCEHCQKPVQAYRLVLSEPLNVNQLKALDKGLERATLPEKPEQMLCDCEYQRTKGNTVMCFACSGKKPVSSYGKPDNSDNVQCPNITTCLCITYEDCTLKNPVVEPSESQEEIWKSLVRFIDDRQDHGQMQLVNELKEKFTITRK